MDKYEFMLLYKFDISISISHVYHVRYIDRTDLDSVVTGGSLCCP